MKTAGGIGAVVYQNATTAGPVLGTLGEYSRRASRWSARTALPAWRCLRGRSVKPATLSFVVSDYNYDYLQRHVDGDSARGRCCSPDLEQTPGVRPDGHPHGDERHCS